MKYRKKPLEVEAIQWVGNNREDIFNFVGDKAFYDEDGDLWIHTLEGVLHVKDGFYVIKGIKNEFYPCDPEVFHDTYDKVGDR